MTALLSNSILFVAFLSLSKAVNSSILNQSDGELRFNEHTMIMSHNSAANKDAADGDFFKLFGVDQEDSIYEQLTTNGVRGLSLDIKLDNSNLSKLRLVHNPFDYGDFETEMQTHLVPFLEENEEAVLAINFEVIDQGGAERPTILANLQNTFSNLSVNGVSLKDMTFKYDTWEDHDEWPTLNEMRSSGQRLFVFHDRTELRSTEYGFIFRGDAMKENFWEGLDDCTARYQWDSDKISFPNSNLSWSRLFLMNHFESIAGTVGEDLLGGGINGWGVLYPRIKQCMESNGSTKPNFISLDWVIQVEQALEVAHYLNFGGRIGLGQRCLDDSHCATESCNEMLSTCQCKDCDSTLAGSCFGCEADQYCAPVENSMNECLSSAEVVASIAPTVMPTENPTILSATRPSSTPTNMPVEATISPTTSPVETTASPTTSSPTSVPSAMPVVTTALPTTASPSDLPSVVFTTSTPTVMPVEITANPTLSSQSPSTETPVAGNVTQSPMTPMEIQSQSNIANVKEISDDGASNASSLYETLFGIKAVLAIVALGQVFIL